MCVFSMGIQCILSLTYLSEDLPKAFSKTYFYVTLDSVTINYVCYKIQRTEEIQNILGLKENYLSMSF